MVDIDCSREILIAFSEFNSDLCADSIICIYDIIDTKLNQWYAVGFSENELQKMSEIHPS